jgi:hypothetical protein
VIWARQTAEGRQGSGSTAGSAFLEVSSDLQVTRRDTEVDKSYTTRPGSYMSEVRAAEIGGRSPNEIWGQRERRDQIRRVQAAKGPWIHVLGCVSPPFRGCDWSQRLGNLWEGHTSTRCSAFDILHSVPPRATYVDIVGAVKGRYGDHQLAAAYRPQLKARTQLSGESLQELGWIEGRRQAMPSHNHHRDVCDHRQA